MQPDVLVLDHPIGVNCRPKFYYAHDIDEDNAKGEVISFYGCSECIMWHGDWTTVEKAQAYYLWYWGYKEIYPDYNKFVSELTDKEKSLFMQVAQDFCEPVWAKLIEDISRNHKVFKERPNRSSAKNERMRHVMIKEVVADLKTNFSRFESQSHWKGIGYLAGQIFTWKRKYQKKL